jgi:hypothetical protein
LENADENHLAKILFSGTARSMGADELEDERIKATHQFVRGRIIVLASRRHERVDLKIIRHLFQDRATLDRMTVSRAHRLQKSAIEGFFPAVGNFVCNRCD